MKLFLFGGAEQSKNFFGAGAPLALHRHFGYCGRMLSVVIETLDDEDALARTLAALVGAAVEGVVREVIVCDRGSSDRTHAVAEHAGCRYLADASAACGIRQAKGDWLLLLEPGARPADGWIEVVVAHASTGAGAARFTRSKQSRRPLLSRLRGRRPLAEGLLIPKTQALALAGENPSAESLARAVSARRLGAEIHAAPARG